MANQNKVFLIGNMTKDPEVRNLTSGKKVVNMGIATNETYTNQSGEKVKDTEFHNIVAWGHQAVYAEKYLKKGHLVSVEGKIKTRSWDAEDGTKKYVTEIVAFDIQGLNSNQSKAVQQKAPEPVAKQQLYPETVVEQADDELPF